MAALTLYRGLTTAGLPVIRLMLARRQSRGKEDAGRIAERFGVASAPRPTGPLVWLHAASVGEAQSVLILIRRLMATHPRLNILVTTGTTTSARLMANAYRPARCINMYRSTGRVGCGGSWIIGTRTVLCGSSPNYGRTW